MLILAIVITADKDCVQAREIVQKTPERKPAPCKTIKNLEFGLKLSDDFMAGTYDNLGATLDGPAGSTTLAIAEAPSRGFQTWIKVDMKSAFGSDTIDIHGIDRINLTAEAEFWTLNPLRNDEFKVQGARS